MAPPPGVLCHSRGLTAPFVSPHSRGYASHLFLPASVFSPCPGLAPWRPCVPTSLAAADENFLVSLPLARTPTCIPPASLSCVTHGNTVSVSPLPPRSPLVVPSSSVSSEKSLSLPPLHSLLSAALSHWSSLRRSPLHLLLLTCSSWPRHLRSSSAVFLHLAVVLRPFSASPCGLPHASPVFLFPLFFSPPPPEGPCGRSSRPSRFFPWPRPPILPVGMKIMAIKRAGLLHVGWWRGDLHPAGKSPIGLA